MSSYSSVFFFSLNSVVFRSYVHLENNKYGYELLKFNHRPQLIETNFSGLTAAQFLKTCHLYIKKPNGKKSRTALRKLAASYEVQEEIEDDIVLQVKHILVCLQRIFWKGMSFFVLFVPTEKHV